MAPASTATGYRVVNQPNVRDRSRSPTSVLLAAVALQLQQHRRRGAAAPAVHGEGGGGDEDVVDAAVDRGGDGAEQPGGGRRWTG